MTARGLLLLVAVLFSACDTRVVVGDLPPCNAQLCPDGCCSFGECIPFVAQDADSCGKGGAACTTCPGPDATCSDGACFRSLCGPCAGCCSGNLCVDGAHQLSCGRFGQACGECQSNQNCVEGRCVSCGPHNCAGCCDAFGDCLAGNEDLRCGSGGSACRNCGFDGCVGGSCQ